MNASLARLKQFALGAIAVTFTAIPFHLLWASCPFERAQSETSREIIEKNHSLYATCEIRDWSFKKPFAAARMTMPAGAVIDTSSPTRTK